MPFAIVEVAVSALAANTWRRISAIAVSSGAASHASSARWPASRWAASSSSGPLGRPLDQRQRPVGEHGRAAGQAG